jgi:hypothetical protein
MVMLRLVVTDSDGLPLSVTCGVKLDVPGPVGVPEIIPVLAFRVRPLGKLPWVIDQVYGVNPPVAANVALYAIPVLPFGSEAVVICSGAAMVIAKLLLAEPRAESETATVIMQGEHGDVGVPDSNPAGLMTNPGGRLDPLHAYGGVPPVAMKVVLYAVLTRPDGSGDCVLIWSGPDGVLLPDEPHPTRAAVRQAEVMSHSTTFLFKETSGQANNTRAATHVKELISCRERWLAITGDSASYAETIHRLRNLRYWDVAIVRK